MYPSLNSIAALLAFWSVLAFAAPPEISPEALEQALAANIMRVDELRFIREEAKRLGVRVWLFGGTAAGYGHYVRWDLERQAGDTRYQPSRFDFDYTNIFRSTQDLDLVVDGAPEKAEALQKSLQKKYRYVSGSKPLWEVRLLKEAWGDKEALLHNADFLNQHTDSNSTGLIEVSEPVPAAGPREGNVEPVVRDLRDWDTPRPRFFEDIRRGKLHYYFSEKHGETPRAQKGLNPPIFSAIRYLTKAFQYELDILPEDRKRIAAVIRDFDAQRDLKTPLPRPSSSRSIGAP